MEDNDYNFETFYEDLTETLICGHYKDVVEMISETDHELDEILQTLCVNVGLDKTMTLLRVMQNEGYLVINKNYKDKKD